MAALGTQGFIKCWRTQLHLGSRLMTAASSRVLERPQMFLVLDMVLPGEGQSWTHDLVPVPGG